MSREWLPLKVLQVRVAAMIVAVGHASVVGRNAGFAREVEAIAEAVPVAHLDARRRLAILSVSNAYLR